MFGNLGELKQMFDKYKKLQESLKNTVIRAREGGVLIDISGEMKVKDVKIEDETLLSVESKSKLEDAIKNAFEKGQLKAQEIATQKTKEILGFDPNDIASMMGGGGMGNFPGLK